VISDSPCCCASCGIIVNSRLYGTSPLTAAAPVPMWSYYSNISTSVGLFNILGSVPSDRATTLKH
jgi:hypothetical protein